MRTISFVTLLLMSLIAEAQILKPAKWTYDVSQKEVKVGEEIDLIFSATIDKEWYLYSSDFDPDLGPTVTSFTFKPNDTYQLVGGIKPVNPKKKYDELWEGEYTYFTGKGVFRQKVKILKPNPKIEGNYEYQVCSDVTGQCIPFDEDFSFNNIRVLAQNAGTSDKTETSTLKETGESANLANSALIKDTAVSVRPAAGDSVSTFSSEAGNKERAVNQASGTPGSDANSLLTLLIGAFLSGLVALLTPCVYPMVPMTVTFFTRKSTSRSEGVFKALIYGLSIIVIYVIVGVVFSLIFGPAFPNFLSTHWLPNVLFFLIFIIFGLSFLGLFEINLPGSLITKVDSQADKGGLTGVFFMAFTIVLVSFSCTGPIAGSILIASSKGEFIEPILGMVAYSMAFAIPFTLFAIFPNWLSNLPKSGGWLNSVKVVLGFLELALALKFLSIADQVYHWGILDRDVFLAFWIVIFSLIGFYLLAKIRLPHDPEVQRVSVPRVILAMLAFTFVVYLLPGMFGAPLKALAGYLPPQSTQDFDLNRPSSGLFASHNETEFNEKPKYSEFLKMPHGLNGFFDYEEGLAYAKKVNKPILIDFTGHGCVNCREVEARVWSDPTVLKKLANDYVVISLYVDDKYKLDESDWYVSSYDNKVKKTIGAQNADFQITRFGNNAQPYYILLDHTGKMLIEPPIGYTLSVDKFTNYLDEGIRQFKKGNNSLVQLQ